MASDSGLSAWSRVIRGGEAGSLDYGDCGVKLPGNGLLCPLPPTYERSGKTWGGSLPIRGGQAGTLAHCECEVKFPGNRHPRPMPPPTCDVVKFGVVQGPSSDHSTAKLNFSVIVTPACAADTEACGTWSTRTWSSSACGACFCRRWPGVSSGTCCNWHNKPRRGCCLCEKLCEKKPGANLPGVVHHKLWRGQLLEPVPHTPVHSGRSPRVVVVAQEVDGLVVLPGVDSGLWFFSGSFCGGGFPC